MTKNWITKFSEGTTDLPEHTTELRNKTTTHTVLGKQHNTSLLWSILGILVAVLIIAVVWSKCRTSVRGFYSVVKQNNAALRNL
jgi:hypothetical protein